MQRLDTSHPDFDARLMALTAWEGGLDQSVAAIVASIIDNVARRGDEALLEFAFYSHSSAPFFHS